ncbi:substrate-binding periplasmic protein [Maridesulfovibrio hydrothermalis]|uniref:Putative Extracellular solute-binding protein family 3 n=1 Tax=Maridesulfovibrio hydrothermalis AM13 = DSM 14728 TaxID=1121451 RepID=L0RFT7_9BACT|nr:transporter substrate-binding domain-containing protein [Maridesulfovibrio hydrothermalis]CCO25070.1 putative Extracellular solute-binding protein family 3 [Maridesulfovibrio hydrothermalis AM13 = DSM 14728]
MEKQFIIRKYFIQFIIVTITVISFICPANSIAGQRLFFATDSFAPYLYPDNGKTTGIIYKLMELTFKEMRIPFSVAHFPWKRALLMAETCTSDGIPCALKTTARTEKLFYPEEPLITTEIVIFYRTDTNFTYKNFSSLKGKKIGAIRGYSYGERFDQSTIFKKEYGNSLEQNFRKMLAGRLDLVVAYKTPGIFKRHLYEMDNRISYSDTPIHKAPVYLAFSKKEGHAELAENFTDALVKVKKSASCREEMKKLGLPPGVSTPCN